MTILLVVSSTKMAPCLQVMAVGKIARTCETYTFCVGAYGTFGFVELIDERHDVIESVKTNTSWAMRGS